MTERVYLDWNATAPLRGEALRALQDAAGLVGNPSSVHAEGRAARRLIEQGGVYVNNRRVADPRARIHTADAVDGRALVLRKGNKNYFLFSVAQ